MTREEAINMVEDVVKNIKNKNKEKKMTYFDGIRIGDKIWSFLNGCEEVIDIISNENVFETINEYYDYNGFLLDSDFDKISEKQIAFWDEIKFEAPKKPEIKLKNDYSDYIDKNYFGNTNSFEQLFKFAKLLSLRDQECPDSRGYMFTYGKDNYFIWFDEDGKKWKVGNDIVRNTIDIRFKTKEDAQKICDILNSKRFEL